MIFLSTAVRKVKHDIGSEYGHLSVLVETFKAVSSDTTEHKWLVIDDVVTPNLSRYPSSRDWEFLFSQLRSDDQSLEAITVMCGEYHFKMLKAACNRIGYLLATSSTLELLWFGASRSLYRPDSLLSDGVVKTLSEGLMQTKSLKGVGFDSGVLETEFADVLNNAFTANMQNTSVEWFDLAAQVERLDMVLEALLLSNRFKNLKKIRIGLDANRVSEHTVDNFQMLPELIRRWERSDFDTSREVRVCFEVSNRLMPSNRGDSVLELEQRVLSCWDKWVRANESALMLKTQLQITMVDKVRVRQGEWEALINEMPKRFTQLKSLHIALIAWDHINQSQSTWARDLDMDHVSLLCKGIESADSVESISTRGPDNVLVNCYPLLFQCLQHRQRLKQLSIDGEWYVDQVFRCLMDFLQVNIYVEEVHVLGDKSEWPSDAEGKKVLVSEALRRNREQAAYFSTLRDAKLAFEEAKAARVFLCGNPHAGKTTLRITMMKTRHKESRIVKYFTRKLGSAKKARSGRGLPLKRTKGVDVELLRDDNQMQVSLWDLAGQEIFRALQSLLLPVVT
ncbi:hypothetical protein R1sor_022228 [Riccia sorocarpa]|uniref:Uncharacterized protein n=1 Tax=Riccia sorocarpa TaxID=122646 RepID=A0ABD3GL68_9MARC